MKKIPLVGKILIGFVLGTAIGLALSECCAPETVQKVIPYVAPFGNVLVAMLKMVVYPIILFSLILGAASLPLKKSGRVVIMPFVEKGDKDALKLKNLLAEVRADGRIDPTESELVIGLLDVLSARYEELTAGLER